MSVSAEPANLADMVRARAKTRGDAIAFEFEGRQTSFAELDIKTNRVANALMALGVKPRERIAYLGKNSDIYFELLLGAMKANVVMAPVNWRLAGPEDRLHRRGLQGAGAVRRTRIRRAGPQHPGRNCPSVRTFIATEGGAPDWPDYAAWRDAQSDDDPKVDDQPAGHRDPALHLRHHRQAERRDAVARQFSQSGARPARARSPTGTNGPRTTSRWWRCRSSTSAAPAGACWASITAPRA